jgi:ubiquinone/menaquinone biosynthesis C-methylase UbiE
MGDDKIKNRYDRIAPIYDLLEGVMEKGKLGTWRKNFWQEIKAEIEDEEVKLLEAGVGTGKNIPYYPPNVEFYAVDFSAQMLRQAEKRAAEAGTEVNLLEMDIENLEFADNSFDLIVASCVFCSVPNPVQGLKELKRVCAPGGKIYLLEHMRSSHKPWGKMMDLFNWVSLLTWGANINRKTMENIKQAGLEIVEVEDIWFDIVKQIILKPEFK